MGQEVYYRIVITKSEFSGVAPLLTQWSKQAGQEWLEYGADDDDNDDGAGAGANRVQCAITPGVQFMLQVRQPQAHIFVYCGI
jgi:hypothetical protein